VTGALERGGKAGPDEPGRARDQDDDRFLRVTLPCRGNPGAGSRLKSFF
jgi:hypothetical protein